MASPAPVSSSFSKARSSSRRRDGTVELGPDALIGERALLSADGLRTARVRALSDVRLLVVERADFDRLCGDDPGLAGRAAAEHG